MQLVEIYEGNDSCEQCLGWKRVDNGEQQSWKYWAELPKQSQIAIAMGWVKPVVCPRCDGSGKESAGDGGQKAKGEIGEQIWQLIEEPQGYGFVSDAIEDMPDEEAFAIARGALRHTEQAALRLRQFLTKHKQLQSQVE